MGEQIRRSHRRLNLPLPRRQGQSTATARRVAGFWQAAANVRKDVVGAIPDGIDITPSQNHHLQDRARRYSIEMPLIQAPFVQPLAARSRRNGPISAVMALKIASPSSTFPFEG